MTDTATEDTVKAAATLEADTLQRAGQITLTQAKARVRDRQASPVAHLEPAADRDDRDARLTFLAVRRAQIDELWGRP